LPAEIAMLVTCRLVVLLGKKRGPAKASANRLKP
jgi:hypothetical protein